MHTPTKKILDLRANWCQGPPVQLSVSENVTANIRAELARRGKTQGDLAQVIGLTQQAVSRRLTGSYALNVDEIAAIADWLNVPVAQFLEAAS